MKMMKEGSPAQQKDNKQKGAKLETPKSKEEKRNRKKMEKASKKSMAKKSKQRVERDYARNAIADYKAGKKSEANYEKKKALEVAAGESGIMMKKSMSKMKGKDSMAKMYGKKSMAKQGYKPYEEENKDLINARKSGEILHPPTPTGGKGFIKFEDKGFSDKDIINARKYIEAGRTSKNFNTDRSRPKQTKPTPAKMSAELKYMPIVDRERSTMSAMGSHKILKHMKGRM